MAHVELFWDPICPFAWVTSRWVRMVADAEDHTVTWRFICLRLLNEGRDYEADFPPDYLALHTAGLRMLRVAAAVRDTAGAEAMGDLYTTFGESIWNRPRGSGMAHVGTEEHLAEVLAALDLPAELLGAAAEDRWDAVLRAETKEALGRTGEDVGTPIITFSPGGDAEPVSFFGPVISRVPDTPEEAVALWDAVLTLTAWPGFAEIKRSLRETPQLPLLTG